MTRWTDPQVIAREAVIFSNVIHFCTGVVMWELGVNLPFDWSVISGRKRFRWPMIFYFSCRYLMFFALVGVLIALNVTSEINCQALYSFNQFAGNSAIGAASTLFMIRTTAIWNSSLYISIPLILVALGHWGCLLHGMTTVVSNWEPSTQTCVLLDTGGVSLELLYFYTMSFDLIVLILTILGLYRSPGYSSLWRIIFKDGVVYFAAAFIGNLIPAITIVINLNPVMNIMFSVPAASAASILACRSFIRISTHSSTDPSMHTSGPSLRKFGRRHRRAHTISDFVFKSPETTGTLSSIHPGPDINTRSNFGPERVPLTSMDSAGGIKGELDKSQETLGIHAINPVEEHWPENKPPSGIVPEV